jgi:hypothetical protein
MDIWGPSLASMSGAERAAKSICITKSIQSSVHAPITSQAINCPYIKALYTSHTYYLADTTTHTHTRVDNGV